jgi:hypothetical protein
VRPNLARAWITLTIFSFNPVAWIINFIYHRKSRWQTLSLPLNRRCPRGSTVYPAASQLAVFSPAVADLVLQTAYFLKQGMTSDASNLPEHVPALPLEARAALPPDDPVAARLRGFGLLAILLIVLTSVFKPLSAILVLAWAWRSHMPWREIGYARPKKLGSLAVGIVFGCAFKPVMKVIVMPLLGALQSIPPTITWPELGCTPRIGVHDDCRRGLQRRDRFPRVPVRTP